MYVESASPSPLIRCLWHVDVTEDGSWISPANEFWGLAFGEEDGIRSVSLVGPSLEPRFMSATAGGTFWGAELEAHVFWRGVDKSEVLDRIHDLPVDALGFFELAGVRYPFTPYEQLETLVASLQAQRVLVAEPSLAAALAGDDAVDVPERTLRRHVRSATGLSPKQVQQLQRARLAYELLQAGTPLADAAVEAGFADQAHMTRALRAFAARTPARILTGVD